MVGGRRDLHLFQFFRSASTSSALAIRSEPLTPAPASPKHHLRYSDGVLDQGRRARPGAAAIDRGSRTPHGRRRTRQRHRRGRLRPAGCFARPRIWFSASCNFTILPNSLGLPALPLRMTSVDGSNRLRREIDAAFAALARERPDALFVAPDKFFASRRVQFASLAARDRIPAIYPARAYVAAGGLLATAPTLRTPIDRRIGPRPQRVLRHEHHRSTRRCATVRERDEGGPFEFGSNEASVSPGARK